VALVVVLDSPKGYLHQGGQVAAPAWKQIAEQTLRYLNVPPELPLMEVAKKTAPPIPGESVSDFGFNDSLDQPAPDGAAVTETASVDMVQAAASYPASHHRGGPVEDEKTFQSTANFVTVPSLIGKSLRDAAVECHEAGMALEVVGSGFGVSQNPLAGALVPPQTKIVAKFARRYEKGAL